MKCENQFCLYCEENSCILEEISLDISGSCAECIYIDIDEKLLKQLKNKERKIEEAKLLIREKCQYIMSR